MAACCRGGARRPLLSLHTHNLTERVYDLDQVGLGRHASVNRLVGRRSFVNHVRVLAAFDSRGHSDVIFDGEAPLGFPAGHGASGTVTAAHEPFWIALA